MSFSTSNFKSYAVTLLIGSMGFLLLGLIATEILIREKIEGHDVLRKSVELFFSTDEKNVIFGDSHIARALNPPEDWVNLAYPTENIHSTAHKIHAYIDAHDVEKVILQADPHMFALNRRKKNVSYNELFSAAENYTSGIRTVSSYHRWQIFGYWKVYLSGGTFDTRPIFNTNGWQEATGNWSEADKEKRIASANKRATKQVVADDFKSHEWAVMYESTVKLMRDRDIAVCLITTPVTPEYLSAITELKYPSDAFAYFEDLAKKYGLAYINMYTMLEMNPEFFVDMDHVNKKGSETGDPSSTDRVL